MESVHPSACLAQVGPHAHSQSSRSSSPREWHVLIGLGYLCPFLELGMGTVSQSCGSHELCECLNKARSCCGGETEGKIVNNKLSLTSSLPQADPVPSGARNVHLQKVFLVNMVSPT